MSVEPSPEESALLESDRQIEFEARERQGSCYETASLPTAAAAGAWRLERRMALLRKLPAGGRVGAEAVGRILAAMDRDIAALAAEDRAAAASALEALRRAFERK
ncbi:MAG TPA: hypothetical protein PK280_02720 [Planctomycetota bacterium]|nr:hypothetical protein [Planctomycetota bacterium]